MTGLASEDLTSMQRKTVVLVCMVDSIHVARWIAQFDPTEVKFILFPSGPNRRVHPKILELIAKGKEHDNQIEIDPFGGKLSLPLWALDKFFSDRIRGLLLRSLLKKASPDYIHALEFQHAGYVTLRALEDQSIKTPLIATNYGSDIYWFQRFPGHKKKIKALLARTNLYSAECQRDYLLARGLGFIGSELPLGPNAGGIENNETSLRLEIPSRRRTIAIKGYHGWVGRALIALDAVQMLKDELRGFEIVVYSANFRVASRASRLRRESGLNITVHKKSSLSHQEVLEIFGKARIYVGLSLSDGISTSLLEAMSMGAFPIQTSTSCADEWIIDGRGGILVWTITREVVSNSILRALNDDGLVDRALELNLKSINERASSSRLQESSRIFYNLT
jgi:glycosyltransferase involved in cell wall biosynthesis